MLNRLFDWFGKLGQTENIFSVDRKTRAMGWKIFSVVIFTSNHFRRRAKKEGTHRRIDTQTQRKRARARAHPQNPDHASPQPSSGQPSQAPITPAHCPNHALAKHLRPTNTGPPRSQPTPPSLPIHLSDRQPCTDKLRSWQPTAGRASPGFPMHWPPPLIADLAATDHQPTSLYSTPNPLDLTVTASIYSDSLFPSVSRSFFPLSLSLWINDVFVLIFVSCVVYIF